jgi:hypothetical protein
MVYVKIVIVKNIATATKVDKTEIQLDIFE